MAKIVNVYVDKSQCTGTQLCLTECPEVLEFDNDADVSVVKAGAEQFFVVKDDDIRNAAAICPMDAIIIEEE